MPTYHRSVRVATLALLLLAVLILPLTARAASITVTTTSDELNADGDCSLREAIRAANTDTAVDACPAGSGTDTIELPGGIYTLTIEGTGEDGALTGDLDLLSNLTLNGAGASDTIVDGNGLDRVFDVLAGATVNLNHLTIQNGHPEDGIGGGLASRGIVTLSSSTVHNNLVSCLSADLCSGGGIANFGVMTLSDSTISDNQSLGEAEGGRGGGILTTGELTLINSTVTRNVTFAHEKGGQGAGIWNEGTLTLQNSTVSDNGASVGTNPTGEPLGGGILNQGTLIIQHSLVSGNSTGGGEFGGIGRGGGIFNSAPGGTMTLLDSTVRGNGSGSGGGILNEGTGTLTTSTIMGNGTNGFGLSDGGGIANNGTLSVENSTISSNGALCSSFCGSASGGGIWNGGSLMLTSSTISYNSLQLERGEGEGGGLWNNGGGTVNASNTILAANDFPYNPGLGPDCSGTLTSQGYNLIGDVAGCTIAGDTATTITGVNPLLGPLQDNGGPTLTHALLPDSPAIDTGNPAPPGSTDNACEPTDQRGVARPQDGNGDGIARCDIGAYELEGAVPPAPSPTPTLTSTPTRTKTPTRTPTPSIQTVHLDIKPGSSPNPINLKSKGVIPVAILSTASFDARSVDWQTICFGDDQDPSQGDCSEAHGKAHWEDVNGDGRTDLVLHFDTQQTGIDVGDTQVCLTGKTLEGTAVHGCDAIQTK